MRSGDMRDRVTLRSVSYASSTQSGQGVSSFADLATVFAEVKPFSGDESLSAGAITSQVRYEVSIRFRSDVNAGMRVAWTPYRGTAKTLEILAAVPHPVMTDRLLLDCGVVE